MNNNPKISIIVPIYNMEAYLCECLEAIKNQTTKDWECLLINDGSTDSSGSICDEYASSDSRFKVIHQDNQGVASARNSALAACSGSYIAFCDPDDVPHPRQLERLQELIEDYDADVAEISYESFFSTFRTSKHLVDQISVLNRSDVALELLYARKVPSYLWIKMFRREVIDSMFPAGMVFEDVLAMSRWVKNIRKMVISPEILYSYRRRKGSIVNTNSAKNRIQYLQSMLSMAESLKAIEPDVITNDIADKTIFKSIIGSAKRVSRYEQDKKTRANGIAEIRRMALDIPLPPISKLGAKTWWRSWLLLKRPQLFIALMRFSDKLDLHKHYRMRHQF